MLSIHDLPQKNPRLNLGFHILGLPTQILYEILARLPVWSVFCCRRVCKTFHKLVTDSYFSQLYVSRAPTSFIIVTKSQFLLIGCEEPPYPIPGSSVAANLNLQGQSSTSSFRSGHDQIKHVGLPILMEHTKRFLAVENRKHLQLVNSCNGFLCMRSLTASSQHCYHVCNPVLGEFMDLPPPFNSGANVIGFAAIGFGSKTKKYKILQFSVQVNGRIMAELYTVGESSWRVIENSPALVPKCSFDPFLNDALHWVTASSRSNELVYAFDLDKEEFRHVPPPKGLDMKRFSWVSVGVLKSSLCLCYVCDDAVFEAWVMNEYGFQDSWRKEVTIDVHFYYGLKLGNNHMPVGFTNSGDMWLVCDSSSLVSYMCRKRSFKDIDISGITSHFGVARHIPSFISLADAIRSECLKLETVSPTFRLIGRNRGDGSVLTI